MEGKWFLSNDNTGKFDEPSSWIISRDPKQMDVKRYLPWNTQIMLYVAARENEISLFTTSHKSPGTTKN